MLISLQHGYHGRVAAEATSSAVELAGCFSRKLHEKTPNLIFYLLPESLPILTRLHEHIHYKNNTIGYLELVFTPGWPLQLPRRSKTFFHSTFLGFPGPHLGFPSTFLGLTQYFSRPSPALFWDLHSTFLGFPYCSSLIYSFNIQV